jgi:ADP-ribose pyrophosphatase YjhB (NUDIX family)
MWYRLAKSLFALSVNVLNLLLAGNLPPFVCVQVIIKEQGRYLVIESSRDDFTFPGGLVRWREHPAQAAYREGKEETGLHLSIKAVVGCYPCVASHFGATSCLDIVFCAEVVGGTLRSSVEGKARWLEEPEVRLKMSACGQKLLDDYLHLSASGAVSEAVDIAEQKAAGSNVRL